jgi:hypothetical protein
LFPTPKITTADIERAESHDKTYKLGVGHGLYVQIEPNGAKYWRFKYRFLCREKRLSFGVFPETSLEQAIEQTEAARALLKAGKDPSAVRQEVAKQRVKAQSMKSTFRIDLSDQGCLTIETERHAITLSSAQTDALKAFLFATKAKEASC